MKAKEYNKLRRGDYVTHRRYGLGLIVDRNCIGLVIVFLSLDGINLLNYDSGVLVNRLLEDSKRRIIEKVENPKFPMMAVKEENETFTVMGWADVKTIIEGETYPSVDLGNFETLDLALEFLNKDL